MTWLRKLAANCEFHNLDKELKSGIIQNCHSKHLRRYALREEALTLNNWLSKARSLKASESQATGIKKSLPQEEVNHAHGSRPPSTKPPQGNSSTC